MSLLIRSKISLVGAGPGDVDLITVKGLKALQDADVVLYDALVNPELLAEAPKDALKIYVGKRANKHRYQQETINLLLVQYALSHGHVVRLKGGDPFVFGRGQEEMAFAQAYNVKVEVIPGISSCISLPGLQGVPMTCRGLNQSFWVVTGTTRSGNISEDIELAAQSSATIVVLMGMRKLEAITAIFKQHGKSDTPVMIIQNGSLPNEKIALGTVSSIVEEAQKKEMGTPAILVFGEVNRLHPDFISTIQLPSIQHQSASPIPKGWADWRKPSNVPPQLSLV